MTRLLLALAYTDGRSRRVAFAPTGTIGSAAAAASTSKRSTSSVGLTCGWDRASWHFDATQPLEERFVVDAGPASRGEDGGGGGGGETTACEATAGIAVAVGGGGAFGAAKSERGDWAPTAADVRSLRGTLERLCGLDGGKNDDDDDDDARRISAGVDASDSRVYPTAALAAAPCNSDPTTNSNSNSRRHAVIYQRNVGRALRDPGDVASRVGAALGDDWIVTVVTHDDFLPPCLLARCLGRAELLLTPHGFQSMLYLFLPPRALLYEVFPHRYYKHGYKRAALEWGLSYGFTMSPPSSTTARVIGRTFTTNACMQMYYCRYNARKGDVSVSDEDASAIARAVAAERGLRGRLSTPWKVTKSDERSTRPDPAADGGGSHGAVKVTRADGGELEAFGVGGKRGDVTRAACMAKCAANHSCQRFRLSGGNSDANSVSDSDASENLERGRCMLRIDESQGEKDGDVIGAGIYNNKCWVPGC
jgi:hypothetical protein